MENLHRNRCAFMIKIYIKTQCFPPFSASFYPPLHRNGKGSIKVCTPEPESLGRRGHLPRPLARVAGAPVGHWGSCQDLRHQRKMRMMSR